MCGVESISAANAISCPGPTSVLEPLHVNNHTDLKEAIMAGGDKTTLLVSLGLDYIKQYCNYLNCALRVVNLQINHTNVTHRLLLWC